MVQWRIKEISDLTKVSVRTLHHYDKIGLLQPSVRSSNGYRWYSKQDLVRLQQIIALKFFGFSLEQIKTMLKQTPEISKHLQAQQQMLKDQAEHLRQAQDAIAIVLQRYNASKTLDWNNLITLIERYNMAEELKNTWASNLNENQLSEYISIKQEYPKEFDAWEKAIESINSMKLGDPEGSEGERIIKLLIDITKKTASSMSRQRKLNSDILRSIKQGQITEAPLSPEGNAWVSKASLAYYLKRCDNIYENITKNLNADPEGNVGKQIVNEWRELVKEAFIGTPPDLAIGIMLWQEMARQKTAIDKQKTAPTIKEQVNSIHVKLLFNPEALSWIEKAMIAH